MNTPTMTPGTVEMVSLLWIMQNADHSVDHYNDWEGGVNYLDMALSKAADCQFPALVSTIMTKGFRVPIVLCLNYDGSNVTHGNGHHRMIAALLLGLDEIPVFWSDYEDTMDYMCTRTSESEPLNHGLNLVKGLWEEYYSPWC